MCHVIHQYAKANNKCVKVYDRNKESSYLVYQDINNLYGWTMPQKLPVANREKISLGSMKNSYKTMTKTVIKHILLVYVKYSKEPQELHSDMLCLPKRMQIAKCEKIVCNLCNKKNYVIHIKALKQALDQILKLKKSLSN